MHSADRYGAQKSAAFEGLHLLELSFVSLLLVYNSEKNIGNSPGKPLWGRQEELPMHDWSSLSHVRWDCKYHIVFVPKYRQKKLYGKFRSRVGEILRDLCRQRGVELLEGHLMPDHIHMCLSVPPKYSIAFVIGFLKGKSAVRIHRKAGNKRVTGLHFWARGYCVSTVGLDEATIRKYIREQEKVESQQKNLFD